VNGRLLETLDDGSSSVECFIHDVDQFWTLEQRIEVEYGIKSSKIGLDAWLLEETTVTVTPVMVVPWRSENKKTRKSVLPPRVS
jgi:hypothetical protein